MTDGSDDGDDGGIVDRLTSLTSGRSLFSREGLAIRGGLAGADALFQLLRVALEEDREAAVDVLLDAETDAIEKTADLVKIAGNRVRGDEG